MHAHLQKLLTTTECWCSLLLTLLNCTKLTRRLNVFIYFFVNVFLVLRSHLVKLNDVCLQVSSGPSISQFSGLGINDQRYLPTKGCLLLSPANLWNRSRERWERANNPLLTKKLVDEAKKTLGCWWHQWTNWGKSLICETLGDYNSRVKPSCREIFLSSILGNSVS